MKKRLAIYVVVATVLVASLYLSVTRVIAGVPVGYTSQVSIGGPGTSYATVGPANPTSLEYIASAPAITTLPVAGAVTGVGVATATLQANLTDLHSFPSAQVYFQWSYDLSYANSTTPVTVTNTGIVTTDISFNTNATVHYRAVAATDGTNFGNDATLAVDRLSQFTGLPQFILIIPLILYIVVFLAGGFGLRMSYMRIREGEIASVGTWLAGFVGIIMIAMNLIFFPTIIQILNQILTGAF